MNPIQTCEEYMWEHHYRPIAEKLPPNRKPETVDALRALILNMSASGYAAAHIGRLLGKDHTTILYHLGTVVPSEHRIRPTNGKLDDLAATIRLQRAVEKAQRKKEAFALRLELEAKLKAEREARRALRRQTELDEKRAKDRAWKEKRKQTAILREKAFGLYKKGLSYRQIALQLGIQPNRVEALLMHHPDWKKHRRKIEYNRQRTVLQYDMQGNLIAEHKGTREAGAAVGAPRNSISCAARGLIKTCKGFIWRYKETANIPV